LRHISHWLALSSKASSRTMVTQSLAGQTASQTPAAAAGLHVRVVEPSGVTSKQESGHWIQQRVHFTHLSKSITGRMVRVVNFLKYGLRSGT
jgi:ribosomal protein L35AE/L33A